MAAVEPGKCALFYVFSLMTVLMLSLATWNLIQFLSPFPYNQLSQLLTGGYERNDDVKSTIKEEMNSRLPGVGTSGQTKNNESLFIFANHSSYKDSRLWYTAIMMVWDGALLFLFVLQHRYMARPEYKRYVQTWDTEGVVLERSVYLLATAIVIQVLVYGWVGLDTYLWYIDWPMLTVGLYMVHVLSWIIIFAEAFLMDVKEVLGLKQVEFYCNELESPINYKKRGCQRLYKHMRHPGLICLLVILWLYPVMSLDRYLLASIFSLFLLCGHHIQECDYEYVLEMHEKMIRILRHEVRD